MAYPDVTDTFLKLLSPPVDIDQSILDHIERFIVVMYSKTCSLTSVNEARREMFTQGSRTIENIPPTLNALIQHLRRAVYQAGYIWAQALESKPELPSPEHWGWTKTDSGWKPFWTDLSDIAKSCQELVHCGCKKGCKHQCKCRVLNFDCTELCYCKGVCGAE